MAKRLFPGFSSARKLFSFGRSKTVMKALTAKQVLNFCVQEYTKSTLKNPWDRPVAITEKLSNRSGCTTNSITNWLRGDNEPRFNNLLALVEVCGYDLVITKKEETTK